MAGDDNYYFKNKEQVQKRYKKYYLKNKEIINKRHQKYNKIYYERGKILLRKLKINGCAICGYNKCDISLDFHHTNPEDKKFGINNRHLSRKDTAIIEELNKCILLCKNCHSALHNGDISL